MEAKLLLYFHLLIPWSEVYALGYNCGKSTGFKYIYALCLESTTL